MCDTFSANGLAAAGIVLELVAFGLVVWELMERAQSSRKVKADGTMMTVGLGTAVEVDVAADLEVIRAKPATLEEKVERLSERLDSFTDSMGKRFIELEKSVPSRAREIAQHEAGLAVADVSLTVKKHAELLKPLTTGFRRASAAALTGPVERAKSAITEPPSPETCFCKSRKRPLLRAPDESAVGQGSSVAELVSVMMGARAQVRRVVRHAALAAVSYVSSAHGFGTEPSAGSVRSSWTYEGFVS